MDTGGFLNFRADQMSAAALFEKRALFGSTVLTLLGCLFEIIAVSTDSWLVFDLPGGLYQNATGRFLIRVRSGLWRTCKVDVINASDDPANEVEKCENHNFFPTNREIIIDETVDNQILDYMRTGSAFAIITLLLMLMGHVFAFYTLRRPRYVIKRLTALLHIMTGACIIVMNEVFIRTVEYADDFLPERLPEKAEHQYGFSFVLSWIIFVIFIGAGLVFLFMSHKKKTDVDDEYDKHGGDDEPVMLGR